MSALLKPDAEIAAPITCILCDVDGVMTDGRIIYDANGCETKQFHVKDGVAIKAWMRAGFQFGILTARKSPVVIKRAEELGVQQVRQGFEDKWPAAQQMLAGMNTDLSQVCYIGDDLPDIPVMKRVSLAVTPADGAQDVRNTAHWILQRDGGRGAVRELVERLLRAKQRWEEHVPG
ncbi:MAG: HAD hydrolase family protein [Rubripirellula sp.]|nr:HAD hydrolase family protein [Rubripirellula sp.]